MVINNIDIMKIGIILSCVGFLFFGINSSINAATISASEILGQINWTANTTDSPSGSVNGSGFNNLSSLVLDTVYHRLFVSDQGNNRILIFQLDNNNSIETATAQYVLGACDLTTAGTGFMTASTFGGDVVNIEYDSVNKRLFVSDFVNARVLLLT